MCSLNPWLMTVVCDVHDQFRKRMWAKKSADGRRTLVQSAGELGTDHTEGFPKCTAQSNCVRIPEVGPGWVPTWFS